MKINILSAANNALESGIGEFALREMPRLPAEQGSEHT
jgi:hypothetical protein